ncbi:unnamed protein product, partial [Prorocentrum cordatum]
MFDMLTSMKDNMKATKEMTQIASDTTGTTLATVKNMKITIEELRKKDAAFETEVENMTTTMKQFKPNAATYNSSEAGGDPEVRELQAIAKGLGKEVDQDVIIELLQAIVKQVGLEQTCTDVTTFAYPSAVGVLQFKSIASKIGFLKNARSMKEKWYNDKPIIFKCNDSIEKRAVDRELGHIKYRLIEDKDIARHLITIEWASQV